MDGFSAAGMPGPSVPARTLSRALGGGAAYWVAMLAASAWGTNLGDVASHGIAPLAEFVALMLASVAAIGWDRAAPRREIGFWIAIVVLRAAATNIGDALRHVPGIDDRLLSVALCAVTLLAARFGRSGGVGATTPLVDARYWTAMFCAGVFGTVAGDLCAHAFGVVSAAVGLTAALIAALAVRGSVAPRAVMAYWVIVLVERAAGTPIGDGLAFRHGADLGLPVAMACAAVVMAAALLVRRRQYVST